MRDLPNELSSLITCYLKPKDLIELVLERDDDELEMVKTVMRDKTIDESKYLMMLEKNCADEFAILSIQHTDKSVYKIKRTDFIKINNGSSFEIDDNKIHIDGEEIRIVEYLSYDNPKQNEKNEHYWFPQSMRDKLFEMN
jgi:Tfp pilus assembly protein PilP